MEPQCRLRFIVCSDLATGNVTPGFPGWRRRSQLGRRPLLRSPRVSRLQHWCRGTGWRGRPAALWTSSLAHSLGNRFLPASFSTLLLGQQSRTTACLPAGLRLCLFLAQLTTSFTTRRRAAATTSTIGPGIPRTLALLGSSPERAPSRDGEEWERVAPATAPRMYDGSTRA